VFVADRGDDRLRLDLVLCRHLKDVSGATRTKIQAAIAEGRVTIDDRVVSRPSARVLAAQRITLDPRGFAPRRRSVTPQEQPLRVVYEDGYLLIIDKPAGLVVHPTYAHADGTLMNGLLWRARQWTSGERPSLVGRLDKATSGIVLVAKTRAAHAALQRTLSSRHAEKYYVAVVYGRVTPARGRITAPLGRDPQDRRRVVVSADGAPSETRYERIDTGHLGGERLSLVRCRLMTGRMHQIRVHLASRGWPIVGDAKYATPPRAAANDEAYARAVGALAGQALHAERLAFDHPWSGQRIECTVPLPEDWQALLRVAGLSLAPAATTTPSGRR
jgi:23S rRNA pseudouridine1911/1915/1917 synthase